MENICQKCGQPTYAKGLCKQCYMKQYSRKLIICENCGLRKKNHGRGLCHSCYEKKRYEQIKSTPLIKCIKCGRRRQPFKENMCKPCYHKKYGQPLKICENCGQAKKIIAKGLCSSCYEKNRQRDPEQVIRNRIWDRNNQIIKKKKNLEYLKSIDLLHCSICGYNRSIAALELHHMNPKEKNGKEDSLGKWLGRTTEYLIKKLEETNFIIVCSNCHREIHWGRNEKWDC